MRVIFKQTGQTGTIPDNKFDPNLFTKIGGDSYTYRGITQSEPVKTTNPLSDLFEGLRNVPTSQDLMMEKIIKPVTKAIAPKSYAYAENTLQGLMESLGMGKDIVLANTPLYSQEKKKQVGQDFINYNKKQAERKKIYANPKNIAKTGLEAASLIGGNYGGKIPGVENIGNPVVQYLLDTLTGYTIPGALTGGMRGASKDEATPQSVVSDAKTGATISTAVKVGGDVVGEGLKLGKKALKWGKEKLQNTVMQASPSQYKKASDVGVDISQTFNKWSKDIGQDYDDMIGVATEKGRGGNIKTLLTKEEKILQKAIKDADASFSVKPVALTNRLQKEIQTLKKVPGNEKTIVEIENYIKKFNKLYKKGITFEDVLNIKRQVDSDLARSVIDEKTGSAIAQAQKITANNARAVLSGGNEMVAKALDNEQELIILREIMKTARSKSATTPFPITFKAATQEVINPLAKKATLKSGDKSTIKQITDQVTKDIGLVSNQLPKAGAILTTGRGGGGYGGTGAVTPGGENVDEDEVKNTIFQNEKTTTTSPYGEITPEMVSLAYQVFPEDAPNIEKAYKAQQLGTTKKMSSAAAKDLSRNQTAYSDILEVERLLTTNPESVLLSAIPGSLGARKYRAMWGGIVDAIGTNRTGAAYTKEQRKDYEYMLPKVGDSQEEIDFKIKRIKGELYNYVKNISGSSSIEDFLNQIQQ